MTTATGAMSARICLEFSSQAPLSTIPMYPWDSTAKYGLSECGSVAMRGALWTLPSAVMVL